MPNYCNRRNLLIFAETIQNAKIMAIALDKQTSDKVAFYGHAYGSWTKIKTIDLSQGRPNRDFGRGFTLQNCVSKHKAGPSGKK